MTQTTNLLRSASAMIDWLDPAQTVIKNASASVPDGGPLIQAAPGVKPGVVSHNGKATVSLKPWGTMILAPSGEN